MLADLIAKLKRFDMNGEIIFDRQEPIGIATDLVMPRRRWFGRGRGESTAGDTGEHVARHNSETQGVLS